MLADWTTHLATHAEEGHVAPVWVFGVCAAKKKLLQKTPKTPMQALVRLCAERRIKFHASLQVFKTA